MPATNVTPNSSNRPLETAVNESFPEALARSRFVYAVNQHGTEDYLKSRWLGNYTPFRLAFSRPGLLTFKISEPENEPLNQVLTENSGNPTGFFPPRDVLIRQSGFALGQLRGRRAETLVEEALALAGQAWDAVHVFARDRGLPGDKGFEPIATPLSQAVLSIFARCLPHTQAAPEPCRRGARVLDVILVEPDHWLIGFHRADEIFQRWPGGVFPVEIPPEMVSRAYLKMAEALAWSRLPVQPGDEIVEIGSSPGGACQRLLDLGMQVTGVDPAEMHPLIMQHPRFEHWRSKSNAIKRKKFSKFRWLAADANVAPSYILEAVEDVVTYPTSRFEGLLLTIKLSSYELVRQLPDYLLRIRKWGFQRVEARQLSFNRRECCVVAYRQAS